MTTPAELFHRAGVALYGDQYVAPMAHLLSVDKTTVRNWAAGKSNIPLDVWSDVLSALHLHEIDIGIARQSILTATIDGTLGGELRIVDHGTGEAPLFKIVERKKPAQR